MSGSQSELRLSEEQKVQLADWAVRAGDSALDYLFMTYLPLPFLAGHTLRLALRFLPAPLRDAVAKLCREYANDLRPPELQVLDSSERALGRVARQLLRVGWAVAGLRVLPALVTCLVGSPQHQHQPHHQPVHSRSQSVSSIESIASTGPGALAAWVATGIMAAGQGVWSGDQFSRTLIRYQTEHPATFLPFLFPEHFSVGHRVQDAVEGAAEWLGISAPSDRRREKWLREFMVRLLLHAFTVHGYFGWLSWMAPKDSPANVWAKCLGVAYFFMYMPSFRT